MFFSCNNSADFNKFEKNKYSETKLPPNAIPIIYNEYVLIKGKVENNNANLLIDIGSDRFCIDSIFKNSINTKDFIYNKSNVSGIGSSTKKISEINDTFKVSIGEVNHTAVNVPVIDMKPIGGDLIDGLVGTDFFKNKVVLINYSDEYICVYNNLQQVNIKEYKKVKMTIVNGYYCIPLEICINDTTVIKGNFIIDTGMPMSTLTSAVVKNNNLQNLIKHKVKYYTAYGGIGGESAGYDFIANTFKVSDYLMHNVIMSYSIDEAGLLSDDKYYGIIGNNILERFDVIFDFKNSNVYFKPNKNFNNAFAHDKFGFLYVDRFKTMKSWIVTGLFENSSAEKSGLKIDDRIISVNNIPVEKINYKQQKSCFMKINNLKLSVLRNEKIEQIEFKLNALL